jgi:translocation and assembly module TamB
MDQRGVDASAKLVAGRGNTLNGKLFLPGAKVLTLDPKTQELRASADLDFKELDLIEALLPEIDKLQGDLALDFKIGGTLEQPELGLDAVISDGSLLVPGLGLSIDSIQLTGTTEAAGRFDFKFAAQSGDGSLSIEGDTLLDAKSGWPTTMHIKGDNFEVSRIPEARVRVTPDLTIRVQNRTIDIEGEITVPYAKLQPKDITMAERVSNDTIVIGDEDSPESRWTISTRVSVILGERVTFFGYGFEGHLGGRLFIEESEGQPTRGTGTIKVIEGRYRAYGQRLDIENGRLLFTGGPVTNPGLDLRAVRRSDAVITGIIVKGRLEQPHLELFSIPAMGQTDILSYLLLGRPMENTSGEEGATMTKAALALGVVGGDSMARSIGDRFGLDEMRVESDDRGDQASLVVGRYLSPKVYVSYGVGLVESINTLNLRYHVSERWRLEVSSGENHGADILYTIER